MPVRHFVDSRNALVVTFCWGRVTRDELAASLAGLRSCPEFQADYQQLIELSQSSQTTLDFNDLCGIHLAHDPFSNEGRRAFVAPRQTASFGFARMYQSIVDSPQIEVFDSLANALRWLRLDLSIDKDGEPILLPREGLPRAYRRLWKRLGGGVPPSHQTGFERNVGRQ